MGYFEQKKTEIENLLLKLENEKKELELVVRKKRAFLDDIKYDIEIQLNEIIMEIEFESFEKN